MRLDHSHEGDEPSDLTALLLRPPIDTRDGVYNYVPSSEDYCGNFGSQWNEFRQVQIDSLTGRNDSHERFFRETGWAAEDLPGKVLLDAGCGAGRFAEVALEAGARVVAADISEAAYACARTLQRFDASKYLVVRGDLRKLPLRGGSFDGVYALGVLQHTPDPLASLADLVPLLKPGGRLATWIYEKPPELLRRALPRTYLRAITSHWASNRKLVLARVLTGIGFPVGWALSWFGRFGERVSYFLPYAARHHLARGEFKRQWRYCVMDTFDWYGPLYENPQTERDIVTAMVMSGLAKVVRRNARGMAITGERPVVEATREPTNTDSGEAGVKVGCHHEVDQNGRVRFH